MSAYISVWQIKNARLNFCSCLLVVFAGFA